MTNIQKFEETQSTVKKILEVLQITRIICIDDTYQDELPLEAVLVASISLTLEKLGDIFPEIANNIPDDEYVRKEKIRTIWSELDPNMRSDRVKIILSEVQEFDDIETNDIVNALILSELIPENSLLTLSPAKWEKQQEHLLKECSKYPSLLLFDQDLSNSGGESDGGIKIIAKLLSQDNSENIICGLLTHTVTPEDQHEKWKELSKDYSIPPDRFLVIPKQYLNTEPILFAQNLKLVALSPDFDKLKKKTSKIIEDAASSAEKNVESISIYDLEHIVFEISGEEGLWEPDMLFRLHALFHRLESRRLAFKGGELEKIANRMRSVSHIPIHSSLKPTSSTWKIQRKELYESSEYINQNHLPIEIGDIFKKTGSESKKHYIVLAQPCDLMVRKDGKRRPEIAHVPIAEIGLFSDGSKYKEKLEYFGSDPSESWYVNLKRVYQVRICILDLCVFNKDGIASINIEGDVPGMIRPSWKSRYSAQVKLYKKIFKKFEVLNPKKCDSTAVKKMKSDVKKMLIESLLRENPFKGSMKEKDDKRSIVYNCKRVGRLSRTRAFGLLMTYTAVQSRPAFDVTLSN